MRVFRVMALLIVAASTNHIAFGRNTSSIDFEGLSDLQSVQNAYSIQEVSFSNAISLTAGFSLNEFDFPPHSGQVGIGADGESLTIMFSQPVSNVSAWFAYSSQLTFRVYDVSHHQLAAVATPQDKHLGNVELVSLPFGNVGSVVIDSDAPASFMLDDLEFVIANEPPVARCTNITVAAGSDCTALASIDNGSFDPNPNGGVTLVQDPSGPYPLGSTPVVLTVINNFGESNSCTAIVTVVDTTPPSITCPSNITVEFLNELGAAAVFEAQAVDNCSSATIICLPSSGSTFRIGSTPVLCSAVDAAGNSNNCSFVVTVLGALGTKQNVLSELKALQGTSGARQPAVLLNDAITYLNNALLPSLWLDQTHLQPGAGQTVFNEEKDVVTKLWILGAQNSDPFPLTVLQGFISRLIRADRLLAVIEIQAAQAAGASPKRISEDNAELFAGDQDVAASKYESGIEHYRNAWMHALHMRIVGLNVRAGGAIGLQFVAFAGERFALQASTNLIDWVTIGTSAAGPDGMVLFNDSQASNFSSRFYRAVQLP